MHAIALEEVARRTDEQEVVPALAVVLVAREIGREISFATLVVVQSYIPAAAAAVAAVVVVGGIRGVPAVVVAAVVIDTLQAPVLSRRCAGRMMIEMKAEVDVLPTGRLLALMGLVARGGLLFCTRTNLADAEQLRHSQLGAAMVVDSSQAAEEVDSSMVEEEGRCFPA